MGHTAPVAAVAMGATVIEKHFILSGDVHTEDSHFSLDEAQFRAMVQAIRTTEQMLSGDEAYNDPRQLDAYRYRRSLFAVADIRKGERFSSRNVRSIRPGGGLPPKYLPDVLSRRAAQDIPRGAPLDAKAVCDFHK